MSIALFPRIYFKGHISFDPTLANNFNEVYDASNVELIMAEGQSLAQMKKELPIVLEGSWNHYGTHRAVFENVIITGVSTSSIPLETSDAIIGKQLNLEGKLVDLNPIKDNGTQIFFDEIQIGDFVSGITAKRKERIFARFLSFAGRNNIQVGAEGKGPATNASAVWEVCFPKEGNNITISNEEGSQILNHFNEILQSDQVQGLSIRFHTYCTLYFQNAKWNRRPTPNDGEELRKLYADGKNFSNPAYSSLIGVISPWLVGESEGHPSGRILFPQNKRKIDETKNRLLLTIIEVNRKNKRLTIDLGETVPEIDSQLNKANVDDLKLLISYNGMDHIIATIPYSQYDKNAYEATAGLVDIELQHASNDVWDMIEEGLLKLKGGEENEVIESEYIVIVENRDIYLDQGESVSIPLCIRRKGHKAPINTIVHIGMYSEDGSFIDIQSPINMNNQGIAIFNIDAVKPGFLTYVFKAQPSDSVMPEFSTALNVSQDFHLNLRVLPFDNELNDSISNDQLTWSWIYDNILATYDVLNPVMARQEIGFDLDNRSRAEYLWAGIKERILKDNFESAKYMPVTRELSEGKRKLLLRWCELVSQGKSPAEMIPETFLKIVGDGKSIGHPSLEGRCPISHLPNKGK